MLMFQLHLQYQAAGRKGGVEGTSGRVSTLGKGQNGPGFYHLRHKASLRSLSQRPKHHLYIDEKRLRQMEKLHKVTDPVSRSV